MSPQDDVDFGMTLKLPTKDEVEPGARRLDGCFVSKDTGRQLSSHPDGSSSSRPCGASTCCRIS